VTDTLAPPQPPEGLAPTVVALDPPSGAREVDPARDRLRITFSEPMRPGSRALLGGGDSFPEVVGEDEAFEWVSPTELEIKVQLVPGRSYRIGVNSRRYQGFRALDGTPSVPATWTFTTASRE